MSANSDLYLPGRPPRPGGSKTRWGRRAWRRPPASDRRVATSRGDRTTGHQGGAFLIDLLQQSQVNVTFADLLGDQIPQVPDLRLPDAMDTAETLLQAVGVPGQVAIDHQVSALEVDAFAGGVEDLYLLVLREGLLGLLPVLPAYAAVNGDHGLGLAEEDAEAFCEVVQRVAVFGEDDELAAVPLDVEHPGVILQ